MLEPCLLVKSVLVFNSLAHWDLHCTPLVVGKDKGRDIFYGLVCLNNMLYPGDAATRLLSGVASVGFEI